MNKYILSGFADEFDKDIDGQLAMMHEQGLEYFEPRSVAMGLNLADCTIEQAKEIKRKMDSYNIKVSAIGSPLGKVKLSDDLDAHMEKTKHVCEIAGILGTDKVRMFSFYPHEGKTLKECRNESIENVGRMLDIADSFNITFCHENEHDVYGENIENCVDLLKTFNGRLKAVFDMGNFVLCGCDPLKAYEEIGPYTEYFHIKDATASGAIVPPGCGEAKIAEILAMHKKPTFVSLEPHLMTFEGLANLTNRKYDNPYVYENKQVAFLDALKRLREICG